MFAQHNWKKNKKIDQQLEMNNNLKKKKNPWSRGDPVMVGRERERERERERWMPEQKEEEIIILLQWFS